MTTLPLREIETVFLDVENTLISIDFAWVQRELDALGAPVELDALRRAEAAAWPEVSAWVASAAKTEGEGAFHSYLRALLRHLPSPPPPHEVERLASSLEPILRIPGEADRLWCEVLRGVPEALLAMRRLGLSLVVVSNADGTVERSLRKRGLRERFDHVIDSHVVGFQKPDPRIFGVALERAGAAPETTLHVGDLYAADVVGARAAGCHALLLDPYDDWNGVDCAVLPDLPALAHAFEQAR